MWGTSFLSGVARVGADHSRPPRVGKDTQPVSVLCLPAVPWVSHVAYRLPAESAAIEPSFHHWLIVVWPALAPTWAGADHFLPPSAEVAKYSCPWASFRVFRSVTS